MKRNFYVGAGFLAVLAALGTGSVLLDKRAAVEAAAVQAPRFEVDPMWPKPLPNHWLLGNDHRRVGRCVRIIFGSFIARARSKRMENYAASNPPASECCAPAPPVLEFDRGKATSSHTGADLGEGYNWPVSNHGITVDYKGNVWIGGNGRGTAAAGGPALPDCGSSGREQRRLQRQHDPEIHPGREIPDADRKARPEQGQQRRGQLKGPRQDVRR